MQRQPFSFHRLCDMLNTGELFPVCLSCQAIFTSLSCMCVYVCQTEGCKNALRRLLKHWPLQKTTDLFKTVWYTVCVHTCMFLRVHKATCVCVTWCTASNILSHQPSLTLTYSQMSLCMVGCMIYRHRYNGVATVMNLLSVWCMELGWRERSKYYDCDYGDDGDGDDDEILLLTCRWNFWREMRRKKGGQEGGGDEESSFRRWRKRKLRGGGGRRTIVG